MAKNKKTQTPMQRKMQIIMKLKSAGIQTEKQLQAVSLKRLLDVQDITIEDIRGLVEVQDAVKNHGLFAWLCTEDEPTPVEVPEPKNAGIEPGTPQEGSEYEE